MKTYLKTFVLMTALLGLASCGQKVSEKELMVSSSFFATGESFNGELVVKGTKIDGAPSDSFIRSVVGSGSVKVTLPDGKWDISIVGWSASENLLEGVSECGRSIVDFGSTTESASITISSANCKNEEFSGVVGGTPAVYPLAIVTCGSFYEHTISAPSTLMISGSTGRDYCNNNYHPLDLKSEVRSIKVELLHKELGAGPVPAPGIAAFCYTDAFGTQLQKGTFELTPKIIPARNVPLKISLFKEDVCANPGRASETKISDFIFGGGLKGGIPNGDSVLNSKLENGATYNRLFLPTSDTKRGYSAFYELMPSFKCGTEFCLQPSVGNDYYVQAKMGPPEEAEFVIGIEPVATCPTNPVALETWTRTSFDQPWTSNLVAPTPNVIDNLQTSPTAVNHFLTPYVTTYCFEKF